MPPPCSKIWRKMVLVSIRKYRDSPNERRRLMNFRSIIGTIILLFFSLGGCQTRGIKEHEVSSVDKKAFQKLLAELPTRGEFYTDESVTKAAPYTNVLFAFTQKEIDLNHIYPYLALSRGLVDRKDQCDYGVKHFSNITHPTIKLSWAVMLLDKKVASAEILNYLRTALKSNDQSKLLAEMLGPEFEDFRKLVRAYKISEK